MKRILYFIIALATLSASPKAFAQQYPLFTNYVINTYAFNPAATGLTEKFDIRGIHRTQWIGVDGGPQTSILALNGKLGKLPIGVGGYIFRDVAGRINKTGGNLMLSVIKKMGTRSTLSVGVSGGYYKVNLQADPFVKDLGDPIVDNSQKGLMIPDLSVGVYFKQEDGLFAGISVPQLYKKKLFFDPSVQRISTTQIVRQYFGIAGYDIRTSEKLVIEPSVLVKVSRLDGTARLLVPARDGDGVRIYLDLTGETAGPDEASIDSYLHKRASQDNDVWSVEIEDREGRSFLTERVDE